MLRRPLHSTPRLARQLLARNCYSIVSPHAYHVQWRRASSFEPPTGSTKAPRTGKRYCADEDSIILQMRASKHDWTSIASALPGRNLTSEKNRFHMRLDFADVGQNYKRATKEELATIRDMLARGFYVRAIAEKVWQNLRSTYRYCDRYAKVWKEQQPSRPIIDSSPTATEYPTARKP